MRILIAFLSLCFIAITACGGKNIDTLKSGYDILDSFTLKPHGCSRYNGEYLVWVMDPATYQFHLVAEEAEASTIPGIFDPYTSMPGQLVSSEKGRASLFISNDRSPTDLPTVITGCGQVCMIPIEGGNWVEITQVGTCNYN